MGGDEVSPGHWVAVSWGQIQWEAEWRVDLRFRKEGFLEEGDIIAD